jgi:23S rRNA pseudouridine1911/1915/1917 synthase
MIKGRMIRNGPWLELSWPDSPAGDVSQDLLRPRAGSHPHEVRQWLLARSALPPKWLGRLFSVGGIRWQEDKLQLLAFPPVDPREDALYRKAAAAGGSAVPDVLYEDDFCLVLNKPAGMPVHESTPGQRGTLDEAAARHLLDQGDPLLVRHIHRLDDDTSGPVLYAKSDLAQLKLDEAMREKRIDRQYLAVVHGHLTRSSGTIDKPIGRDRHHRSRRLVTPGGDQAITHYEVLQASKQLTLVRLTLETGRTHQIRVHMSYIGHPLVGDGLYSGDGRMLPHQALHGERLLWSHPWTGEPIEAVAPRPDWLQQLAAAIAARSK